MDNFSYRLLLSFFTLAIAHWSYAQKSPQLANEYYQQGELAKAYELYTSLEKEKNAIPLIHANYRDLLIDKYPDKAQKYLIRIVKLFPNVLAYQVDLVEFYKSKDRAKYDKLLQSLHKDLADSEYKLAAIAKNFASAKMNEESLDFYNSSRMLSRYPYPYALEMASLYRQLDQKGEMTEEYINYAESNPANINYVKNLFQNILTDESDQDILEDSLIKKIQKNPDNELYADLLMWLLIQRKDYYGAFIQARALDNRLNKPGDEAMKIAGIASQNGSWEDAINIYEHVIERYPNERNYSYARAMLIDNKEKKVKSSYPVDTLAIRNLADDYLVFFNETGSNPTSLDAMKSKALLHAFYLSEVDTAIIILESIIQNARAPQRLISQAKLELGDIYLYDGQPWESTLLYSQVEKANKETPMGYEAKLKNAELNYYQGNFSLAKSHLDILKRATTRTTANDALTLSQIITNNTVFDTTDQVMQDYAAIHLLVFTNQKMEARKRIDTMLSKYPRHSIADELYWQKAQIDLESGRYENSIQSLDQLMKSFGDDILADDALFRKAVILQDYIQDKEEAYNNYLEFLKRFPGSRHSAEVRKRIRLIRGDV